jgi:transposase
VPTEAEEAVRDLVRARAALLADRKRAQKRITAMLMRHGRIWRGTYWTQAHEQWIAGQRFGEPALASALAHYREALDTRLAELDTRLAELDAVEDELSVWTARPPLAAAVTRLGWLRSLAASGHERLSAAATTMSVSRRTTAFLAKHRDVREVVLIARQAHERLHLAAGVGR